ncbi:MAG: M15 family metallopeptidase, partial [Pseudonocardia sp.]|nr:M15 family metallopeptidase [Pseudonocardia sp.]
MFLTENGWPSCAFEDCDTSVVPGTDVSIPVQTGIPNTILKAFLAALNEYIEPYNGQNDWGGWTATNSVATSNHLGGTAVDFNWNDHPMGPEAEDPAAGWKGSSLINGDEVPAVRELLDYCEGMVFWGNDWDTPKDSMHFQMGYGTYDNGAPDPKCMDFINRKIDPATMKLLWVPSWIVASPPAPAPATPPPPPPAAAPEPAAPDLTAVLAQAMGNSDGVDYASKVAAVTQCLQQCACTTLPRAAMWCAQVGEESGGLRWMEEIADGSEYEGDADLGNTQPGDGPRFKGRGPIQVTGRHNYTALSQWAFDNGLVPSATFFVDDPEALASDQYGFMGVTWYWTTQRPMNDAADAQDVALATQYVNGGENGLADRTNRFNAAMGMGDVLLTLVTGEDDLMSVSDDLTRPRPNLFIYRDDDDPHESLLDQLAGVASQVMELVVETEAKNGDPGSIEKVRRVAEGRAPVPLPDWAQTRAQMILDDIAAAQAAQNPPPAAAPPPPPISTHTPLPCPLPSASGGSSSTPPAPGSQNPSGGSAGG